MKDEYKNLIPYAASFFKVVGDETRMRILYAISESELCVNDISRAVNMEKSAVSHQLRVLKEEGLIKSRRDGKNIFYSLDDQHVTDILEISFMHITHKLSGEDCCEKDHKHCYHEHHSDIERASHHEKHHEIELNHNLEKLL